MVAVPQGELAVQLLTYTELLNKNRMEENVDLLLVYSSLIRVAMDIKQTVQELYYSIKITYPLVHLI